MKFGNFRNFQRNISWTVDMNRQMSELMSGDRLTIFHKCCVYRILIIFPQNMECMSPYQNISEQTLFCIYSQWIFIQGKSYFLIAKIYGIVVISLNKIMGGGGGGGHCHWRLNQIRGKETRKRIYFSAGPTRIAKRVSKSQKKIGEKGMQITMIRVLAMRSYVERVGNLRHMCINFDFKSTSKRLN